MNVTCWFVVPGLGTAEHEACTGGIPAPAAAVNWPAEALASSCSMRLSKASWFGAALLVGAWAVALPVPGVVLPVSEGAAGSEDDEPPKSPAPKLYIEPIKSAPAPYAILPTLDNISGDEVANTDGVAFCEK